MKRTIVLTIRDEGQPTIYTPIEIDLNELTSMPTNFQIDLQRRLVLSAFEQTMKQLYGVER